MLEVCNLRKEYGPLVAVQGVSLTLNPGDIFGFIGSNGAGKTTTIKMIATLLEPTSGTARLNGADILQDPMAVRQQLGYMPDFFGLYDEVRVWEYLDFFAALYQVPNSDRAGIIDNVLELTTLTGKKDAFVQSLSRGMQQRLCLARCLVHDPALLLLDEPASGLDPRARAELKELIAELGRMGKIVVVSSHILPELADFCNTVGIIERGELLAFGPVETIVEGMKTARGLVIGTLSDPHSLVSFVQSRSLVQAVAAHGETAVALEFQGGLDEQAELLDAIIKQGFKVVSFHEEKVDLEDVFLKLTTGAVN